MRGVGTLVIVAAAMTLAVGLASAQSKPATAKPATAKPAAATAAIKKNPVVATPASIKLGQTIFNKQCRHCHGPKGKGDGPLAPTNPKPADLSDAKWEYGASDGEIFNTIWNGAPKPKTEMKGMKDTLTEKDVWNVINFLRSIGPKPGTN